MNNYNIQEMNEKMGEQIIQHITFQLYSNILKSFKSNDIIQMKTEYSLLQKKYNDLEIKYNKLVSLSNIKINEKDSSGNISLEVTEIHKPSNNKLPEINIYKKNHKISNNLSYNILSDDESDESDESDEEALEKSQQFLDNLDNEESKSCNFEKNRKETRPWVFINE